MRIARLSQTNQGMQGARQREALRIHNPEHLDAVAALVRDAFSLREPVQNAIILGAGACTEIPLADLAARCRSLTLVDLDEPGMRQARMELPAELRRRVDLVACDLTGGVSASLAVALRGFPWDDLMRRGHAPLLDALVTVLEACPAPHPPDLPGIQPGRYAVVISSLALSQLVNLPLLDVVDALDQVDPVLAEQRDLHSRYQQAARELKRRIALAHLALIRHMLAEDGIAVLMSDRVGYLVEDARRPHAVLASFAVLPPEVLRVPDDLAKHFQVLRDVRTWPWLANIPEAARPGRRYDVFGALLRKREKT